MAVAEDRSPVYSWSPSELVTGDDIPYVMLVRGYRAEKRIAVLWTALPQTGTAGASCRGYDHSRGGAG